MDELGRIQTFIRVVQAGGFSAAARIESSTSSVARQIKSLEDDLGVRLLNRNTRSVSLTEAGRLFYERAVSIANNLHEAVSEASSFQDEVKGILRVSLRISAGTTVIVPALPTLLERYPQLIVDVSLTDERKDLIADYIDVAVWMGDLPSSELIAKRLSPSRRIVCGSPGYFAKHGTPAVPEDLKKHNCLLFGARSYGNVWRFSKGDRREEIEVHGNLRSENGLVLLSAATSALGVFVAQEWMVSAHLAQATLTRVLVDYTVNPTVGSSELFAVYPSSRGLSRKVRAFIDFLEQLFGHSTLSTAAASTPRAVRKGGTAAER